MKELLETMVKNLVDDQNSVVIEESQSDKEIVYEVKVSQSDMGKVIGRQGKTAKSIRVVMKALAAKENKKIRIEFIG